MTMHDDEELMRRAKAHFDASVEALDEVTRARLAAARARALAAARRGTAGFGAWWPAGAFATVLVLVTALALWPRPERVESGLPVEDIDMLLAEDGFEFYEELEFYLWLEMEEQDHAG